MINVKSPNLAKAKKQGKRVFKAMDLKKVNKAASIFLDQWVQINFKGEGSLVGKWQPFVKGGRVLTKNTKPQRSSGKKIDNSAKLLQDHGTLRSSFRPFYDSRVAGIGSKLPYAKTHDQGLGNAIERRMLPVDKEVQTQLRRMYGKHVRVALNA